jgi:hypothetical protein
MGAPLAATWSVAQHQILLVNAKVAISKQLNLSQEVQSRL